MINNLIKASLSREVDSDLSEDGGFVL